MLILPFWQTSSININLLIEPSPTCSAEKEWMKATKKEFVETSELVNENFGL